VHPGAGREAVDEAVDEVLLRAADVAVLLRHRAHEVADLGVEGLAVGGVGADVDEDRPHRLAGQLGRDRHLPTRVGPERQVAPDHGDRGARGPRARRQRPGRGRGAERGQHARAAPKGRPPAHAVAAQVAPQPLLLLADRHRCGQSPRDADVRHLTVGIQSHTSQDGASARAAAGRQANEA